MGGENCKLIEASRSGSMQRATKAIRKGAEVDETDADGKAALHYASKFGHVHIIELLIDKKANIDLRSLGNGETPLHKAVKNKKYEACRFLIKAGANYNTRPRSGPSIEGRKAAKDYPKIKFMIQEIEEENRAQGASSSTASTTSSDSIDAEPGQSSAGPPELVPYVSPKLMQRQQRQTGGSEKHVRFDEEEHVEVVQGQPVEVTAYDNQTVPVFPSMGHCPDADVIPGTPVPQ